MLEAKRRIIETTWTLTSSFTSIGTIPGIFLFIDSIGEIFSSIPGMTGAIFPRVFARSVEVRAQLQRGEIVQTELENVEEGM